jgi:diguanylate cyclase (GGDEF)-like protein
VDTIPGYADVTQISETPNSSTFRARKLETGQGVIIKTSKVHPPSLSEIARYKRDYELIRKIDSDGLVKLLDIIFSGDELALVSEDEGGLTLKQYLWSALPLDRFLSFAIRIVDVVHAIHQRNIAHRDINPANIVYHPGTDVLKLTNISIASDISRSDAGQNPYHALPESLAYVSPEQTGRMNCAVDYRTDFYSLGVTFYEMITGEVPFAGDDPLEMIYAHLVKLPVPPETLNPKIPAVVSAIIMRLLAKGAHARYQSSIGLLTDLKSCIGLLQNTGHIGSFEIARHDISPRFFIPQMRVERDAEIEKLFNIFSRSAAGKASMLVVTGESGIGKSALVHEIAKPIVAANGYFISGTYDPVSRGVPYSGIIEAIVALIGQLASESEDRAQAWRVKLRAVLRQNGKVLTDIIPDTNAVLGPQPDLVEVMPEEAQNRFKMVFCNFLRVFADEDHPLVLFLDDLQWADRASLELMQTLLLDGEFSSFLLIGAYRDDDIDPHHPLLQTIDRIEAARVSVDRIALHALARDSINCLLCNVFGCSADVSNPLAAVIHKKTSGNPLFFAQFLRRLHAKRYLSFDASAGWQWDVTAIERLEATGDVVRFITDRLQDLEARHRSLIKVAACIGNRFDIETLAAIAKKSIDETLDGIDALIGDGLISYRGRQYRFHHHLIHEAAYGLLLPDEKEKYHYRIGRYACDASSADMLWRQVFYVAGQLNMARAHLIDSAERTRLAHLNLDAGIKAKQIAAYDTAVNYLKSGMELLSESPWTTDYRFTYALHCEQMECQYLVPNFEEAERLFRIIIENAADKIDKAKAYNILIGLYTDTRLPQETISLGISALNLFGVRVNPKMGPSKMRWELTKAKRMLSKMSRTDISTLPLMTDESRKVFHQLLFRIANRADSVNPNLYAFIVLKAVNDTWEYGLPVHAPVTLIRTAVILQNALGDYPLGYAIAKMAMALSEKLDQPTISPLAQSLFASFVQHWSSHARRDLPLYRKAYQSCRDHGNVIEASRGIIAANDCRLIIGDQLDSVTREMEKDTLFINKVRDPMIAGQFAEQTQIVRTLKGLHATPLDLSTPDFDEAAYFNKLREQNHKQVVCFSLVPKIRLLYLFGHFEQARVLAEEVDQYIHASQGPLTASEHCFYYSLILAAALADKFLTDRDKYQRIIARNQKKLDTWAKVCPDNFRHKHDLVQAELVAASEKYRDAPDFYHAAITSARQYEYINDEALACERLSIFYQRNGAAEESQLFMQRAHQCYGFWGAVAKQREIEKRHDSIWPASSPKVAQPTVEGEAYATETVSGRFDLETVTRASQAISREIIPDQLLKKTLQISVTHAGAQRGYLIVAKDGRLEIEVCEDPDRKEERLALPLALDDCPALCHAIVHFVSRSREPIVLSNACKDGPYVTDPYIEKSGCKSLLCAPIVSRGQLSAIVYLENNLTPNAFTKQRQDMVAIITAQAAISLENARLFELATTDVLTRLFVHRYFQVLLDQEIGRSRRYGRCFSLVMIDIDNFKHVNETYGYAMGDEVLKRVARALRESLRAVDIAARYGGEEFVLVLPETDLPQALIVCEKILDQVRSIRIAHNSEGVRVTVSMGVATFPNHASEKDTLLGLADDALYASKRAGKNRVSIGHRAPARPIKRPD